MSPTPGADAPLADGLVQGTDGRPRCWWSDGTDEYRAYHDREWGRPVTDENRLFEKICLEGFQSGLSWLTILRKREHFRDAFAGFDFERVARFTPARVDTLLGNAGIVRHRGKIESTINNARRAGELAREFGSLAAYFWQWETGVAARPAAVTRPALLAMNTTPGSIALSKDLKRRGWTFVGPTTVYAFMQAMGLVNDHLEGCHVRPAVERARTRLRRPRPAPTPPRRKR
jgi:DNA-3-methyladenine glycosylase I